MKKVRVNVHDGYDILIEEGILNFCGKHIKQINKAQKICLVSDTNVYPIYKDIVIKSLQENGFEVIPYVFEAGEVSKTMSTVMEIIECMAQNNLTREDLVVALGGGVCGDMAGFAAAIYLRGIKFVQIPTSLLAQVDSSVGGKTAVNLPQGKNLCGAFYQPCLVLIDPNTLQTLTPKYFSDGMAEAIKMGCIKSKNLFEKIEKQNAKEIIKDIIFECVSLKADIVEKDEKEHRERALLNFGHTAGHAIEKLHKFTTISHGEVVGIGMVLIAKAGEANGITEKGTANRISKVLEKYNLKTKDTHTLTEIINAMSSDKKRTGNAIKFILLYKIGDSFIQTIQNEEIPVFFKVGGTK